MQIVNAARKQKMLDDEAVSASSSAGHPANQGTAIRRGVQTPDSQQAAHTPLRSTAHRCFAMPLIPCLDCGRLINKQAANKHGRRKRGWGRCDRCAAGTHISNAETRRRAQAVAHHRAVHGDWCPGWRRPPHHSTDLTADHRTPVAAGGSEQGQLAVLCRSCNSTKQHTT